MASWASPYTSGLATTTGRNEFVSLRTNCSLPVALHLPFQERSYFQLIGSDQPMSGLAPDQSNSFTGALVSAHSGLLLRVEIFHSVAHRELRTMDSCALPDPQTGGSRGSAKVVAARRLFQMATIDRD
jgi:hypothetical protein